MTCNTTCYKRDTCNTKRHRAAIFAVAAKAMTNIRSMIKIADMFPTHQRLYSECPPCIHLFVNTRPTAPNITTRYHLVLQVSLVLHLFVIGQHAVQAGVQSQQPRVIIGKQPAPCRHDAYVLLVAICNVKTIL
eukprot:6143662-Pleurochrysis_carterae.AAC.1